MLAQTCTAQTQVERDQRQTTDPPHGHSGERPPEAVGTHSSRPRPAGHRQEDGPARSFPLSEAGESRCETSRGLFCSLAARDLLVLQGPESGHSCEMRVCACACVCVCERETDPWGGCEARGPLSLRELWRGSEVTSGRPDPRPPPPPHLHGKFTQRSVLKRERRQKTAALRCPRTTQGHYTGDRVRGHLYVTRGVTRWGQRHRPGPVPPGFPCESHGPVHSLRNRFPAHLWAWSGLGAACVYTCASMCVCMPVLCVRVRGGAGHRGVHAAQGPALWLQQLAAPWRCDAALEPTPTVQLQGRWEFKEG